MLKNKEQKEVFNLTYKKITNLTSAVFLVVDSVKDNIILKDRVRVLSLEVLSDFLETTKGHFLLGEENNVFLDIERKCLEIKSILDIMFFSGYISESNKNILRSEFNSFISGLDSVREVNNNSVENILSDRDKEEFKDSNVILSLNKNNSNFVSNISNNWVNNHQFSLEKGKKRKDLRKTTIFEFIKKHKDVSIKDIVPNIKGCGEKTIQRELIELIDSGQVKKIGERRWSRYMVA